MARMCQFMAGRGIQDLVIVNMLCTDGKVWKEELEKAGESAKEPFNDIAPDDCTVMHHHRTARRHGVKQPDPEIRRRKRDVKIFRAAPAYVVVGGIVHHAPPEELFI